MNILIVDDEESYRILLGSFLREHGWKVFSAANGEEAMKVLRAEIIDFIISDVYMPVMDGLKFHRQVMAMPEYAHIPFLFVSGFDDEATMQAVRLSKNTGFMRKTSSPNELKAWIQYLQMPPDTRPRTRPDAGAKAETVDRSRGRMRDVRR
ncbi:MAG TPA: response regulator [Bacteroidota bacterium]|nr:response regulator [Bacteroidota bacterium]